MKHDPRNDLESGVKILEPALSPHGFNFRFQDAGCSSAGEYAWGKYVRGDRSLELHHRRGLGIIQYNIADLSFDHAAYLKSLGVEYQSDLLSTPLESGLERYHALRTDLQRFCTDFVAGPAIEWAAAATADGNRRAEEYRKLYAGYVGDDRKREQARELFRDNCYDDVIAVFDSLQFPDLLHPSEKRMLQIASTRASRR